MLFGFDILYQIDRLDMVDNWFRVIDEDMSRIAIQLCRIVPLLLMLLSFHLEERKWI